jgi:hypothetical protein
MRFTIPSNETSAKFRLLRTPLFCGTEPITEDESIFPFDIDRSLFPKNSVRLFDLLNIQNYVDILNMQYVTLLKNRDIRKISVDSTRSLILEVFYGEAGNKVKELDKKSALKLKEKFPQNLLIEDLKIEVDEKLKDILKLPIGTYIQRFNAKSKKFINGSGWIKKVYHIYNLIAFFPEEYMDSVTIAKDNLDELIKVFKSILLNEDDDDLFSSVSHGNPIEEVAIRLKKMMSLQDERTTDFLEMRFSKGTDMRTIGAKHNISSERVRQKLVAFILECRVDLAILEKKLLTYILNHLIKTPKILPPEFFDNSVLPPEILANLLNTLYPGIPSFSNKFFLSQNIYRENNNLYNLYTRLKTFLKSCDGVSVHELLQEFEDLSLLDKLSLFRIIFAISYFRVVTSGNTFVIRGRLSLPEMAEQALHKSDVPLKLEDVIRSVKTLYAKEYFDLKVSLCHIRMNHDVLQLDKNLFGVQKHISYNLEEMKPIHTLVSNFLKTQSKVIDASVLFKVAKKAFPKIRSKYELVQILRLCDEVVDLGFFCFVHSDNQMTERTLVNDYLIDILSRNNFVMNGKTLLSEINKERVVSVTGFSSKLKNVSFIDYYGGNFYGLSDHREQNIKTISRDPVFISNLFFEKTYPNTVYSAVKDVFKDFDLQAVEETINSSDIFHLYDFPGSEGKALLSKLWKRNKLFYTILYHHNEPLPLESLSAITTPLGIDAQTLKKINFYALGIDFFKNACWIRGKVKEPKNMRRRKSRKKKAAR